MGWIKNIQSKTQAEKLRIIWVIAAAAAAVLIVIWIISARLRKNIPADTTLFDTFGRGIKDVRDNFRK